MQKIEDVLTKYKYPGRGIIFGVNNKKLFIGYFITGRSKSSKNRILTIDKKENVKTDFFKETQMQNKDLIIYSAVKYLSNYIIVSNGNHTNTIYDYIKNDKTFEEAIKICSFEEDPPIYTPRIAGIISFKKETIKYKLAIIKANIYKGKTSTERFIFEYSPIIDGVGHIIHTYKQKGEDVTASFCGEPEKIYIPKTFKEFEEKIWNSLYKDYKISLFIEFIDIKTKETEKKIININK